MYQIVNEITFNENYLRIDSFRFVLTLCIPMSMDKYVRDSYTDYRSYLYENISRAM